MPRTDVTQMAFAKLYPLLVNKAEKKGPGSPDIPRRTSPGWSSPTPPMERSSKRPRP